MKQNCGKNLTDKVVITNAVARAILNTQRETERERGKARLRWRNGNGAGRKARGAVYFTHESLDSATHHLWSANRSGGS